MLLGKRKLDPITFGQPDPFRPQEKTEQQISSAFESSALAKTDEIFVNQFLRAQQSR